MARAKAVDITDEQYERAITHLEKGGTKKAACEILGINYNTKRLDTLLEQRQEGIEREKRLRAKKRKEPVLKAELVELITDYLSGSSFEELSKYSFRSVNVIKYHLEKAGALLRPVSKVNELCPPMLPDQCVKNSFEIGEYAWVAKYASIGKVCGEHKGAYRVKVINESMNQYCYQPAYELGSLQHLIDLGVNVAALTKRSLSDEEILMKVNEGVRSANKRK